MENLDSIALLVISFMLKEIEVVTFILGLFYEFHFDFLNPAHASVHCR